MRLAEALILRADYQKRLTQLRARMLPLARVQEGETPAEDPNTVLAEYVRVAGELRLKVQQINRTNSGTELETGMTIADAIAQRDELQLLHTIHRDLAQAALVRQDRTTKSEVKFVSSVNVAELQRTADDYARRHRELDARLQESNWSTELKE